MKEVSARAVFSRQSDEWSTPQSLFDTLNAEFGFTLDACATAENAKCPVFYTKDEDGLLADWGGQVVFCNPPYSDISRWVEKAYDEGHKNNTIVVLLVPSRTDTRWFHNYVQHRAEIRFIKGRVKFGGKDNAPFPSMLVIFRGAVRK